MMVCEEYLELMMKCMDGEATQEETAALQAHLSECEKCRALYESYLAVDGAVKSTEEEPPEQLTAAIMNSIRREKAQIRPKAWFQRYRFTMIAAAAAVVILVAARVGEHLSFRSSLADAQGEAAAVEAAAEDAPEAEFAAVPEEIYSEAGILQKAAEEPAAVENEAMPEDAVAEKEAAPDQNAAYAEAVESAIDGKTAFTDTQIAAMQEAEFCGTAIRLSEIDSKKLNQLMPDLAEVKLVSGETVYQAEASAVNMALETGEITIIASYQPDPSAQEDIYWIFLDG